MKLPLWHVDAFTSRRFAGNPAAVVPMTQWLPDETLAAIGAENNLPETAFLVADGDDYAIRWFTPTEEVPLCGHATLAAGWVVMNRLEPERSEVTFRSRSGPLRVARDGDRLALDFPAIPLEGAADHPTLIRSLGASPRRLYKSLQWVAVYENEARVRALQPDFAALGKLEMQGVIATAPGTDCDFVSRFFGPAIGIPEDPVTGAAHTRLVPYWARELGKTKLHARQVSARGGELWCELRGDRVIMAGFVAPYLEGTIDV